MKSALIVVDMITNYDFEDAEILRDNVREILPDLKRLIERARDEDALIVYVNDNFGVWNSSREQMVEQVLQSEFADLLEPIVPDDEVAFVLKGRHSIFYQTPLEYLLEQEDVGRVILTGQVTEQCILYSALDAHLRHLKIAVPPDAVAHIDEDLRDASLKMMAMNMDADTTQSADCLLK